MLSKHRSITIVIAAAALGAVALAPAPALAASGGKATMIGDMVDFTAGAGDRNDIVFTRSGRTIVVDDRVAIRAGTGCAAVRGDRTKVRCATSSAPQWITADLGDKNDRMVSKVGITVDVRGQAGNDTLVGGAGADSLWGDGGTDVVSGGAGRDVLAGGAGNDALRGGTGDDILNSDAGADTMLGGAGFDTVYYGTRKVALTIDLDGAKGDDGARGERDTVGADVEGIIAGAGADRLTGNGTTNRITGGPGNDVIRGGAGYDLLVGQAGHDSLYGDAGSDYLVGEFQQPAVPDGDNPDRDDPAARDYLDGGAPADMWGDICVAGPAARLIRCEYIR
jgi:Ca2+-binding RTX toxin-like protein